VAWNRDVKRFQPVSFPNRQGHMLHGMLHEPEVSRARGVCMLLLSPGIKGRVGPHRLYLKIAGPLVAMGFHVLRVDYYGLGDSGGELDEIVMADMYNSIQGGRYVDDTIAAMDWMSANCGVSRFVGSGLCGGSISALLTAQRDARIHSLLGIGLPSTLEGGAENFDRFMSRGQLQQEGRTYLRKLLSLEAWRRFLSGKSGYALILRAVRHALLPARPKVNQAPADAAPDNANPLFAPAFLAMLKNRRPILLIFSSGDRHRFNFGEKFEERFAPAIRRTGHGYQVHLIDGANHVLSDRRWIDEMLQVTTRWLGENYPETEMRATRDPARQ
jgi:pimeloyl-ACP methyl ester carboxylesterase